jgi:hypothetical protein
VVAAGAATAHGLYEVALGSGTPAGIAWLYPVITDGLALVAYAATTRLTGPGRRYAWTVVVLAAGLSGLAQATYLAGALPPTQLAAGAELTRAATAPTGLRFGVGAWPAVAAAIAAHLLFLIGTTTRPEPFDAHVSTPDGPGRPGLDGGDVHEVSRPGVQPARRPGVQPAQRPALGTGVQPELPAAASGGGECGSGQSHPVLSPRDRALTVAQLHERRTGALPSVRELESQAQVSRGTAHTALQELRAHANGLHVVTDTEQNRPDQ